MNNPTRRCQSILAVTAVLVGFALAAPQLQASAEEQATQTQSGSDRVAVTLSDPTHPALVKASLVSGSITVKAYEGKEVIVEAHVRNREAVRSDSGPKRIAISSTGLTVEEENNQVNINTESFARAVDLNISVPLHTSLHLSAVNDGDIVVTGVDGDLDVNEVNGSVTLNNIAGSVVAHALNGRVLVTFTRVNQKAMAFSSLNGDIDVTFPADLKALVSMRSDRGDVFSDFDVRLGTPALSQPIVEDNRSNGGKYRVKIDKTVRGTINGGGPEIQFTNFNGQIYIRKAGAPR